MSVSEPSTFRPQVVCCLAGHIDHGKSSLVSALTQGIVDRLAEEQRRQMTIDLGFTHFDWNGRRFALTDVPGHESFLHTMIAGVAGVDLALLVVAADDSVMPQTREHLAVLQLLGVRRGVVAVSKCDLVDAGRLLQVQADIARLVASTFLADAPVVNASVRTGLGVEPLKAALGDAAHQPALRSTEGGRFRMPIDRVFAIAGQGTVATGTVWRGQLRLGETVHVFPSQVAVRVRRLQSQGNDVDRVSAGQRAAINIVGVKTADLRRGHELVEGNAYEASRRLLVRLQTLPEAGSCLKTRDRVRLHLGANKATAQVQTTERELGPGMSAYAVLRCESPVVAEHGQPFVIRRLSPARTIGGGTIISPSLDESDRLQRCLAAAPALASEDPVVRLAAYIDLKREARFDDKTESRVGLSRQEFESAAERLTERGECARTTESPPRYVTQHRLAHLLHLVLRCCDAELKRQRPARFVSITAIEAAMSRHATAPVLKMAIERLVAGGELERRGDRIGLPVRTSLSRRQQRLLDELFAECVRSGRTPPSLKQFAARNGCSRQDVESLLQVAVDDGQLVRLSAELATTHRVVEGLRQDLAQYFSGRSTAKVSDIRAHWGITRKHAVPIIEYFGRQQITARQGDIHSPGPRLLTPFFEHSE